MFFHTRRFREPERRYRTESLGDTLRPSCRSSCLGRPRSGDSFTRGRLWRGKDTLILLPSRLPSQGEKGEDEGEDEGEGENDDDDGALEKMGRGEEQGQERSDRRA